MVSFHLDIITPRRQAFTEEVDSVVVPTSHGLVGILAHHEPLFSALTPGEIKITTGNKEYFLAIDEGFMEVSKKGVLILVSRAVGAHELSEAEIRKAQEDAKRAIANKVKGVELAQAQAILRRSLLELKVYHHRKHRDANPLSR